MGNAARTVRRKNAHGKRMLESEVAAAAAKVVCSIDHYI